MSYEYVKDKFKNFLTKLEDSENKMVNVIPFNTEKTSNHVHLSIGNADYWMDNPLSVFKVCMAWWYFEPIFLILVGHWRRNNRYCKPIREFMKEHHHSKDEHELFINGIKYAREYYDVDDVADVQYIFNGGIEKVHRYKSLNLVPINHIGTIEVRLKHGSCDADENVNFLLLLGAFITAAINNNSINDFLDRDEHKNMLYELYNRLITQGPKNASANPSANIPFHNITKLSVDDTLIHHVRQCYDIFKKFITKGLLQGEEYDFSYLDSIMLERGVLEAPTNSQTAHGGNGGKTRKSIPKKKKPSHKHQ